MTENAPIDSRSSIQKLFDTLGASYGAAWDRSLGVTPIEQVQAEWDRRLLGFTVADVRHALDNLPSRPPNVFEFRELCRAAPRKAAPQLEQQKADPQRVAQFAEQMRSAFDKPARDPKQWAREILDQHQAGKKVRPITLKFAREALGFEGRQAWQ